MTQTISQSTSTLEVWLNFISKLLTSFPFIILIIFFIFLFNKQLVINFLEVIKRILGRTKELEFGSLKLKFEKEVQETQGKISTSIESLKIDKLTLETTGEIFDNLNPLDEFKKLANIRPEYAIFDAWKIIEFKLQGINQKFLTKDHRFKPVNKILSELREEDLIDSNTTQAIKSLSNLRNEVAHSLKRNPISYNDALDYRKVCIEVFVILDNIKK